MELRDAKRIQRLYEHVRKTRKNCAYEDLERLLLALDFTLRKPGSGGSHRFFKRGSVVFCVPERCPVRENYVDEVLAWIEAMYGGQL